MTMADSGRVWRGGLIDAYAHVGDPKYGRLRDVDLFFERLNMDRGVLVLGPGIPDLKSLIRARQRYGNRVRVMGIPFGDTESQRLELGALQLGIGISGMRLMPEELEANRTLVDQLGQQGRWLYAINPDASAATTRFLLDWLDRHPTGKIASPHFLRPQTVNARVDDVMLLRTLLQHPHFHAIFSRHGGAGSHEAYPHLDLRPWVEELAEWVTWQRILWGSEFPIIYQRNEQPEEARDWLLHLGLTLSEYDRECFYARNAERLLFNDELPEVEEPVEIPDWVDRQIDVASTVYLFPENRIFVPMQDHGTLLSAYQEAVREEPRLRYADFIARGLSGWAQHIRDHTIEAEETVE